MASSSNDPTTGAPVFADADAPDVAVNPTEVAAYAGSVGTRPMGDDAAMAAYVYAREGLAWYNTTDGHEYVHDGSGWVDRGVIDTGWVNLTLSTGWTAVAGHTPRSRVIGNVVYIEGAVSRGAGGAMASLATTAVGHRPAKTTFYNATVSLNGASIAYSELSIDPDGIVLINLYTNMSGAAGWTVPISGSFVL